MVKAEDLRLGDGQWGAYSISVPGALLSEQSRISPKMVLRATVEKVLEELWSIPGADIRNTTIDIDSEESGAVTVYGIVEPLPPITEEEIEKTL